MKACKKNKGKVMSDPDQMRPLKAQERAFHGCRNYYRSRLVSSNIRNVRQLKGTQSSEE